MGLEEDDDSVVYGTQLLHEEELGRRKRKLATAKGQARTVAPWQQEVTDAEGRRRFHGAFTGGFSAGYYNTVGSKEGWTPSTFVSSRSRRAAGKGQTVYDFLDDDEKEEVRLKELLPGAEYNSVGSTAAELTRLNANSEIELWNSVVPGLVLDETIDASQSQIGVKLLMKMGWRRERSFGEDLITFPSVVNNRRGLGLLTLKSDDGNQAESETVQEDDESGRVGVSKRSISKPFGKEKNCLPSFTAATDSSMPTQPLRLPTPVLPVDFTGTHVLPAPLEVEQYLIGQEPPEVASPDVENSKAINAVATFVARSGPNYEDAWKQKHVNNPQFAFLFEGRAGHDFYVRRLWENQRSLSMQVKEQQIPSRSDDRRVELVGANRGEILGEKRLPKAEVAVREEVSSLERASAASELTAQMNARFTAGAFDTQQNWDKGNKHSSDPSDVLPYPRRVETPWRPTALLCRRFNTPDPYTGKETLLPKQGLKMEPLLTIFASLPEPPRPSKSATNAQIKEDTQVTQDAQGTIISAEATDLYKTIFSDDDDEDENERGRLSSSVKPAPDRTDAAEEFLESLGKELGLRV